MLIGRSWWCSCGARQSSDGGELREQVNLVWNTDLIETMEFENLIGQAAQGLYGGEARHESRRAHEFPVRDDVQWMKHMLSRLDAEHVENAKVVLEYQDMIDQPLDDQMHDVPPERELNNSSTLQYQSFGWLFIHLHWNFEVGR